MKAFADILISSSVLILALCALRALLRGRISPRVQYALWLLVALRLLLPVSLGESRASVMNLLPQAALEAEALQDVKPDFQEARLELLLPAGEVAVTDGSASTSAALAQESAKMPSHAGRILMLVWALGFLAVVGWMLWRNLRLVGALKESRVRLDAPGAKLPVYLTGKLPSACLFGLLRPAIYLTPISLEQDGTPNRYVLEHELTHYRRLDHLWGALRLCLLALYWFDPLVWLAAALSREDCELACDEAALKRLGDGARAEYGRTLLAQIRAQNSPKVLLSGATTMASGKRSLCLRIGLIAKKPRMKSGMAALLAALVLLLAACTFTGRETAGTEPEPLPAQTAETTEGESGAPLEAETAEEAEPLPAPEEVLPEESQPEDTLPEARSEEEEAQLRQAVYEKLDAAAWDLESATEDAVNAFSGADARENGMRGNYPNYYGAFADYFVSVSCAPSDAQRWTLRLMDAETLALVMCDGADFPEQTLYYSLQTGALCGWAQAPTLEAEMTVGIGVDTDYADESYVVFHGYFGLFVYDLRQETITCALDLQAATGTTLIQGGLGNHVCVQNGADGLKVMLTYYNSAIGGLSPLSYYIDAASGAVTFAPTEDPDTFAAGGKVLNAIALSSDAVGDLSYSDGEKTWQLFESWHFGEAAGGQMLPLAQTGA